MVLRGIHRSVDTCHTNYTIHSKLRISPLSWSHTWKSNLQANERLKKWYSKIIIYSIWYFCFFFHFLHSNVPDKKCHEKKWHVCWHVHMRLHASNGEDWTSWNSTHMQHHMCLRRWAIIKKCTTRWYDLTTSITRSWVRMF